MKWEKLVSAQNLKLAWRRINTGRNLQYKRFFRESFLVYESGVDDHIKDLRAALKAKVWKPHHANRVYLPKPSGLQRPLSLLDIEDQILLQAISNLVASKLYKKRRKVELTTVFSNRLASPRSSIFFMEPWQITYRAFQNRCIALYNQGYRWAADFDLAAYYDTISHDLLLSIVAGNNKNTPTAKTIKEWLSVWSADNSSAMTGHGIPQGPVASDFLAEAFFLPIDQRLQKEHSFKYIRYVDDIRLFGKSKNDVLNAAILLEQECRHRGLIPQSAKFALREITSPEEAMGALPSIAPAADNREEEPSMTASDALSILQSAVDGRPQRVCDKSRFRYAMYRAPQDTPFLNVALRLLPRHPEHIDAFVAYFGRYSRRKSIGKAVLDYLEDGVPYSYVRGELWHVLARMADAQQLERGLPLARKDAKKRSSCIALSWGVMHFLLRCESAGLCKASKRLSKEHPVSRSLLAPMFPPEEFCPTGQARALLKGSLMEQLSATRQLQTRNLALATLGLRQRDIPNSCTIALKSLGVIGRQYRRNNRDWIGDLLESRYGIPNQSIWNLILATEYEHALQILVEADDRFEGARSEWLSLQDSFNDIALRYFFAFLNSKNLPGHSRTTAANGKMVKYGSLIASNAPFDRTFPAEASSLRIVHARRNSLPGSHPYDERGGARNKWLSKREQPGLHGELVVALGGITAFVHQNM